ncbi:gephyrin-like molybdotransferase Glp [Pseudomonas sp.]|uniref:molybdopterin molybdotransferase MoeA n=1 Tax=Pseudomonas sp. TaxID=306 RepID=UPI00262D3DF9|nr:gephyrin-like molybdotransferase Glp [Pseudomonas sp.]
MNPVDKPGRTGALMPVEDALAQLLALAEASSIRDSEWVDLAASHGRVLAHDLISTLDLPPWPNSAMDGYALSAAEGSAGPLVVSQRIFAGRAPEPLTPGTCARIFTGAPVPVGADCVEMQENVQVQADGRVTFTEALHSGQNIRPQGQETTVGEVVLSAGTRLGPVEQGLAASLGCAVLQVIRRVRVAVLSTGDELIEPGQPLGPGQIYNSNRVVLCSWLTRMGCDVVDAGILPDDLPATRQRLGELGAVDLILSTGGVSVGEADFLGIALREAGELALWKLAIKPGKPLTFGHFRGTPVIGLPGNPASTLVTFAMLARPYLLRRQGVQAVEPLKFAVPAGFVWPKPGNRREYLRARLENGRAIIYKNQSSGVLRSAAWAEGLVEVLEGTTLVEGDHVGFIPLSEVLA